jgi:hypothetical protein
MYSILTSRLQVYDRVKAELSLRRNGTSCMSDYSTSVRSTTTNLNQYLELTTGTIKAQDPLTHVIAAMAGGASGTIVTNPLWVIKTRFMASSKNVRPLFEYC